MSRKILVGTMVLAALVAMPAVSSASVYAVSVTGITNFDLNGGTVSGWTFSQNMALNDNQVVANGAVMDALPACVNCAYNNSFASHGAAASSYSYGDTLIQSSNIVGGTGEAYAIAETNVTGSSHGSALATNSMTASLNVGTGGSNVSFSFDVLSYMAVVSSAYGGGGFSSMNVTISISQGGTTLWNYAPLDLNRNIGPGDQVVSINDNYGGSVFLNQGSYSLAISMKQDVNATSVVPVPAAAWLLGSGLIGLVGVARRKAH